MRSPLAMHLGCGVPLVALAVWFGLLDKLPFGEGRCSSCGLEGYVLWRPSRCPSWRA